MSGAAAEVEVDRTPELLGENERHVAWGDGSAYFGRLRLQTEGER